MSVEPSDASRAAPPDAAPLLAGAAAGDRRAALRLRSAIDDLFLDGADRLDDRSRAATAALLAATVEGAAEAVAQQAAVLLAPNGTRMIADAGAVLPRLRAAGVLRDPALIAELLGQAQLDLLGQALAANRPPDARDELGARLTVEGRPETAAALAAYLRAESGRGRDAAAGDLPLPLYRRLVWWVAAALRGQQGEKGSPAIDRALADAAEAVLAAHDPAKGLVATAGRLADGVGRHDGSLMADMIVDGHAALFVALLGQALRVDHAAARDLVLDPEGDRLWLALRAQDIGREAIARIGLALADADHRRDADALADILDKIAVIPPDVARKALAPLALPADFRHALAELAGTAAS